MEKNTSTVEVARGFYSLLMFLQPCMKNDEDLKSMDSSKFDVYAPLNEVLNIGAFFLDHFSKELLPPSQSHELMGYYIDHLMKRYHANSGDMWMIYGDIWGMEIERDQLLSRAGFLKEVSDEDLRIILISKMAAQRAFGIVGSLNPETTLIFLPYVKMCREGALMFVEQCRDKESVNDLKFEEAMIENLSLYKKKYKELISSNLPTLVASNINLLRSSEIN